VTTTVYYLQWHLPDSDIHEEASDLFHEFHIDPPESLTADEFDRLYEAVTEARGDDLEDLFEGWNVGSGREEDTFLSLRYCERCQTYVEGSDEAVTHATQNHDYDLMQAPEPPEYIRGVRSLSVGDIAEQDGTRYTCEPIGWQELDLVKGDP